MPWKPLSWRRAGGRRPMTMSPGNPMPTLCDVSPNSPSSPQSYNGSCHARPRPMSCSKEPPCISNKWDPAKWRSRTKIASIWSNAIVRKPALSFIIKFPNSISPHSILFYLHIYNRCLLYTNERNIVYEILISINIKECFIRKRKFSAYTYTHLDYLISDPLINSVSFREDSLLILLYWNVYIV